MEALGLSVYVPVVIGKTATVRRSSSATAVARATIATTFVTADPQSVIARAVNAEGVVRQVRLNLTRCCRAGYLALIDGEHETIGYYAVWVDGNKTLLTSVRAAQQDWETVLDYLTERVKADNR